MTLASIRGIIDMFIDFTSDLSTVAIAAPGFGSVREYFTLPDRNFVLDPIDNIPVGHIRFFSMGRRRDHDDRGVANTNLANAMPGDGKM